MGGLRFHLPDHHGLCTGERAVLYSQACRFALHAHLFPLQAQEDMRRMGEHGQRCPAPKHTQTLSHCSPYEPLGDSSLLYSIGPALILILETKITASNTPIPLKVLPPPLTTAPRHSGDPGMCQTSPRS